MLYLGTIENEASTSMCLLRFWINDDTEAAFANSSLWSCASFIPFMNALYSYRAVLILRVTQSTLRQSLSSLYSRVWSFSLIPFMLSHSNNPCLCSDSLRSSFSSSPRAHAAPHSHGAFTYFPYHTSGTAIRGDSGGSASCPRTLRHTGGERNHQYSGQWKTSSTSWAIANWWLATLAEDVTLLGERWCSRQRQDVTYSFCCVTPPPGLGSYHHKLSCVFVGVFYVSSTPPLAHGESCWGCPAVILHRLLWMLSLSHTAPPENIWTISGFPLPLPTLCPWSRARWRHSCFSYHNNDLSRGDCC